MSEAQSGIIFKAQLTSGMTVETPRDQAASHVRVTDDQGEQAGRWDVGEWETAPEPTMLALFKAADAREARDGHENPDDLVLESTTGIRLRTDKAGSYVRAGDADGNELAYWVSDEWRDDPLSAIGAIIGILGLTPAEVRQRLPLADHRHQLYINHARGNA